LPLHAARHGFRSIGLDPSKSAIGSIGSTLFGGAMTTPYTGFGAIGGVSPTTGVKLVAPLQKIMQNAGSYAAPGSKAKKFWDNYAVGTLPWQMAIRNRRKDIARMFPDNWWKRQATRIGGYIGQGAQKHNTGRNWLDAGKYVGGHILPKMLATVTPGGYLAYNMGAPILQGFGHGGIGDSGQAREKWEKNVEQLRAQGVPEDQLPAPPTLAQTRTMLSPFARATRASHPNWYNRWAGTALSSGVTPFGYWNPYDDGSLDDDYDKGDVSNLSGPGHQYLGITPGGGKTTSGKPDYAGPIGLGNLNDPQVPTDDYLYSRYYTQARNAGVNPADRAKWEEYQEKEMKKAQRGPLAKAISTLALLTGATPSSIKAPWNISKKREDWERRIAAARRQALSSGTSDDWLADFLTNQQEAYGSRR